LVGWRVLDRRSQPVSRLRHFDAVLARGGVLDRIWLGIGFTAYIYILKNSTAARVATYAFVNPVVALLLGWMFAGEALTLRIVCRQPR